MKPQNTTWEETKFWDDDIVSSIAQKLLDIAETGSNMQDWNDHMSALLRRGEEIRTQERKRAVEEMEANLEQSAWAKAYKLMVQEEVLRELLDLLGKLPARIPLPKHLLAIDIHSFAKEKGVELNK